MKFVTKRDALLACLLAVAVAGCSREAAVAQPGAAQDAAPVANVVPLPRSLETQPGELRIAGAVALEAPATTPMARRALDELLATLGIARDDAKQALVEEGYDRVYGARPLRRTVERRIENPLSRRILGGEFKDGDQVTVDHANGEYSFERESAPEPVAAGVEA